MRFIPLKNPLIRPATSRIPFFGNVLFSAMESYNAYESSLIIFFFLLFLAPSGNSLKKKSQYSKPNAIIAWGEFFSTSMQGSSTKACSKVALIYSVSFSSVYRDDDCYSVRSWRSLKFIHEDFNTVLRLCDRCRKLTENYLKHDLLPEYVTFNNTVSSSLLLQKI